MPDFDEDTGYLAVKPGDRVFIEYEDPTVTELIGGWGTVVQVCNAWTAKIQREKGGPPLTFPRWLLSEEPDQSRTPGLPVPP